MDAALKLALALQGGVFELTRPAQQSCRSGHDRAVETTGAFIIELEQESLEFRVPKDLGDRSVIARSVELALVVPPAQVRPNRIPGWPPITRYPSRWRDQAGGRDHSLAAGNLREFGDRSTQRIGVNQPECTCSPAGPVRPLHREVGRQDRPGSVHRMIGAAGLFRVVVGRGLLRADQRRLGRMICPGPQVGELFGAHGALPAQLGHDNRPRMAKFLPFFVAEWDRPTTKLVEPFNSVIKCP